MALRGVSLTLLAGQLADISRLVDPDELVALLKLRDALFTKTKLRALATGAS